MMFGPKFRQAVVEAGIEGLVLWADGTIGGRGGLSPEQDAALQAILDDYDAEADPEDVPAQEPPARVYKATMFRRMTDEEYAAYEQIRAQFPPRLAALFDAVEYLSTNDEFWPAMVAAANQVYGEERAAEILAP